MSASHLTPVRLSHTQTIQYKWTQYTALAMHQVSVAARAMTDDLHVGHIIMEMCCLNYNTNLTLLQLVLTLKEALMMGSLWTMRLLQ